MKPKESQIKQVYSNKYLSTNNMQVYWGVTNNCNLNCHYCTKYKEEEFYNLDYISYIIEFINNLSSIKDRIFLKMFGGEPTIHPNIVDILKNINSSIDVELQTNLTIDTPLLVNIINTKNVDVFSVSLHYGLTNRNTFFKNLNTLFNYRFSYNYDILLNLMYEENYGELVAKDYQTYNRLSKLIPNFSVRINLVYHNVKNEYDYDTIAWANTTRKRFGQKDRSINIVFEDGAVEQDSFLYVRNMNYNKYRGMKCSCLKHTIYIDSNGDVYPCQTYFRQLNKKYGNILHDRNMLSKLVDEEYVVCEAETCDCELDIPKWR